MAFINKEVSTMAMPSGMNRMGQFPLDMSSVYYDMESLEAYAKSGAIAYVGQIVSLVDEANNKVTVYSIQNTAGDLKEVGVIPTGDGKTISVSENGQISLLASGDKTAGAQLTLQADGTIAWVKPDTSTAEGQDAAIKALQATVDGTENSEGLVDKVATLESYVGKPAEGETVAEGLFLALDEEIARAKKAEGDLDAAIKAIDFVDTTELSNAITAARTEISKEIDDDVKVAKDRADEAHTLASGKVDATTYATDKAALEAEDVTIRQIAEYAKSTIDSFLQDTDTDEVVNKLKDIQEELEKLGDAVDLEDKFALKADKSEVETALGLKADKSEVETALGLKADKETVAADLALKADKETVTADLALKADKATTEAALAEKAVKTEVNAALELKADKTTLEADKAELTQAIADAKAAAVGEAATAAATLYVDKTTFNSKVDEINTSINKKANADDVYTKTEIENKGYATGSYVDSEIKKEADRAKLAEESNAAEITSIKTGYATDKAVFEQGILDAKNLGNQGITNAAAADAKAVAAGNKAAENAGEIASIKERLTAAEGQGTTNVGAITGLDTRLTNAEAALTNKADKSVVDPLVTTVGEHTGLIAGLQSADSTLSAQVELKADKTSVYTKEEIDVKESALNTAIGTAKTEAVNAVNALATGAVAGNTAAIATNAADIKAIYSVGEDNKATGVLVDLIAAEESRAKGVEAGFEGRIAEMEKFWEAADDPNDTIDKLAEIIDYIDKHEELNIPASVEANAKAIENIYTAANGETPASGVLVNEIAAAKSYADTAASNAVAGIPDAIAQALADAKAYADKIVADETSITQTTAENGNKVFSLKSVSTDLLTNGSDELILFGGYAVDRTATPEA